VEGKKVCSAEVYMRFFLWGPQVLNLCLNGNFVGSFGGNMKPLVETKPFATLSSW